MQEIWTVLIRTIFFYFFVTLLYRIMGKREIGELSIIDLTISILIAELVAISIEETETPILQTILPLTMLSVLEIALAFLSMKSRKVRSFFGGKPSLIICNGKVNYKEMVKQRYSMDDLLLGLRQKEISSIEEIEYAFLEPNGKLSLFKYKPFHLSSPYPMPLIVDGQINQSTLKHIKKDESWLEQELAQKELEVKDIFYAFYKNKKVYLIKKDNN